MDQNRKSEEEKNFGSPRRNLFFDSAKEHEIFSSFKIFCTGRNLSKWINETLILKNSLSLRLTSCLLSSRSSILTLMNKVLNWGAVTFSSLQSWIWEFYFITNIRVSDKFSDLIFILFSFQIFDSMTMACMAMAWILVLRQLPCMIHMLDIGRLDYKASPHTTHRTWHMRLRQRQQLACTAITLVLVAMVPLVMFHRLLII